MPERLPLLPGRAGAAAQPLVTGIGDTDTKEKHPPESLLLGNDSIAENAPEQIWQVDTAHLTAWNREYKYILVAVDDVGFGRTALESLLVLEPDIIKLDRHYIDGVARDRTWGLGPGRGDRGRDVGVHPPQLAPPHPGH